MIIWASFTIHKVGEGGSNPIPSWSLQGPIVSIRWVLVLSRGGVKLVWAEKDVWPSSDPFTGWASKLGPCIAHLVNARWLESDLGWPDPWHPYFGCWWAYDSGMDIRSNGLDMDACLGYEILNKPYLGLGSSVYWTLISPLIFYLYNT